MRVPRPVLLACIALCGCAQASLDEGMKAPALNEAYFNCNVQPVLAKSCAMFLCHGDGTRFFRVYARNRLRYGGTERDRNRVIEPYELKMNFYASRAMVQPGDPEHSFLLQKPLDQAAGGFFHRGATLFGMGDVFLDRDDPDYQALEQWVLGATCKDTADHQNCSCTTKDIGRDAGR